MKSYFKFTPVSPECLQNAINSKQEIVSYSLEISEEIPYLVLALDDAHLDVILGRVPDEPALLRQVCQAQVVHYVPEDKVIGFC